MSKLKDRCVFIVLLRLLLMVYFEAWLCFMQVCMFFEQACLFWENDKGYLGRCIGVSGGRKLGLVGRKVDLGSV